MKCKVQRACDAAAILVDATATSIQQNNVFQHQQIKSKEMIYMFCLLFVLLFFAVCIDFVYVKKR